MRQICLILGLGLLAVIISLSCSKDSPTEPTEPTDYPVYFMTIDFNGISKMYFEYYPMSGTLDSFTLPITPTRCMTLSANGQQLWISTSDTIYVVDIESKTVIAEVPCGKHTTIVFSPDNQYAAIVGTELTILNGTDYSVIFRDTTIGGSDWFQSGTFSDDGTRFFCANFPNHAYLLDLADNFAVTRIHFDDKFFVHASIPSSDERLLFILGRVTTDVEFFSVYDIVNDTTLYGLFLSPAPSKMRYSATKDQVYITAGGDLSSMWPNTFSFLTYSVDENKVIDTVNIEVERPGNSSGLFSVDRFVLSSDERFLIGRSFDWLGVITFDLSENRLTRDLYFEKTEVVFLTSQGANAFD